ncbi:MAG: PaaI family thioesterase [Syntrophobacteraceae bacterium]
MNIDKNTLRRIPSVSEDNICFGCGPENPYGLRMVFYTDGEALYSWVQPPDYLCGWKNVLHGGIQATILDETMGWAAMCLTKRIPLTKEITLSFKKPVIFDRGELLVESRILQHLGNREVIMQGNIYQGNSEPCITAQGTVGLFPVEALRRMHIMHEGCLDSFKRFMAEL